MASEVAHTPAAPGQQHDGATDPSLESTPYTGSQVNGLGASSEAVANAAGFGGNATLPATSLDVSTKVAPVSSTLDANPPGPTPVDKAAPGIQPIADFVPKDASTHSHPTPPPDELLTTGIADADTEMANAESDAHENSMEGVFADSSADPAPADVKVEGARQEAQAPDASEQPAEAPVPEPTTSGQDVKPFDLTKDPFAETPAVPSAPAPAEGSKVQASTAPLTTVQKGFLVEKMKNLKKTRHSVAFLKPVDPVALNIPNYTEIVKQPMDLLTMETKLKNDEYGSVQAFVDDFELIIGNARRFNGDTHAVTQAGFNMKAYFDRILEQAPSILQEPKRRESRAVAAPAAHPQAASPVQQQPFALQSDGTPQIRRASSNVRPARAIKPPQNREIPYAKPKRKEHLLELKFAEHVLDEIRGAKYASQNHVFQQPVDPVALNIPNYHQVIKHPMDLSTMSQKMKSGQYGTAAEVKKDFDLMVRNCVTFNPVGNPVRDLGISLQREFESLWADKNKWEKRNAPTSAGASSASAEGDSDEEEDEEEAGDNPDDNTVAALKKQIAAMQSTLESLSGGGAPSKPSTKPAKSHKKGTTKKAGGGSAAPQSKTAPKPSKPKRERMITYEEKDEISKAVERMDEKQIGKLTEIITRECPKYRDMEEMELEIDDLPNGVQLMLLKYVRDIFGNPNRKKPAAAREYSPDDVAAQDDDDFEPKSRGAGAGGRGGKRKKHAPMSKAQQEEQLRALQGKLQEFSNAATSGSESPTVSGFHQQNAQAESSGDEESEESEEE